MGITPLYITNPTTFVNVQEFSRAAQFFQKTKDLTGKGTYTLAPEGTLSYKEFWDEEDRRCRDGYEVGGIRVTGEHYAYLNYGRIKVTEGEGKTARKYESFPRFLDMDYYYYHELEQARINKQGMIVAKSRRKGFSYKGAFNLVYEYNWIRDSFSIVSAFMGDYSQSTMNMALDMINFINRNTDWAKRKLIDTRVHIKSGFKEKINDIETEAGFKSEIMTMSFKDNPFKSIGKSASIMLFEESGKWPGLIEAYMLSKPLFSDGDIMTGIPIVYGTGGDMEGGTQDFSEMFYKPEAFNFRAYQNVWDENAIGDCGWFVDDAWYKMPHVDQNGNSDHKKAISELDLQRDLLRKSGNKRAYEKFITQHPKTPKEAFLRTTGNVFPVADLLERLSFLETRQDIQDACWIGEFVFDENGKLEFKNNSKLFPIKEFPLRNADQTDGAIVIYKHPDVDEEGNIAFGRYIGGIDPYQQDKSEYSSSLGSTFIIDRVTNQIVAEYTGRPSLKEYYEGVRRLLKYYNARAMYENQIKGLFDYFQYNNCLHMLADEPKWLGDVIKNVTVTRKKGMHMVEAIKDYGEELINSWLRAESTEEGVQNLYKIRSIPLLKELINYDPDPKKNYDRCLFPGIEISTIDGFKKVEDIKSGDLVLTHKGRYKKVTYISKHTPNNESLELRFVGNYLPLKVTNNHPILTFDFKKTGVLKFEQLENLKNIIPEFKEAKDLIKSSYVLKPKRKDLPKSKYSEDLLYLMGWYLSDGCATNSQKNSIRIVFQGNQESMADKVMNIINKIVENTYNDYEVEDYRNPGTIIQGKRKVIPSRKIMFPDGKYCIYVEVSSSYLYNLLRKECGKPNNKILSSELYNSSGLMSLLLGYFEGDGHQKKNANYDGYKREVLELATVYKDLAGQVHQLLIDENIWSSSCIKQPRYFGNQEQICLTISRQYINKLVKNSLKFKLVEPIKIRQRETIIETEDGFWIKLKDVKPIPNPEFVYNFEVEEDHTYVANGILTHNCMALMMCVYYLTDKKKQKVEEQVSNSPTFAFMNSNFFKFGHRRNQFNAIKMR